MSAERWPGVRRDSAAWPLIDGREITIAEREAMLAFVAEALAGGPLELWMLLERVRSAPPIVQAIFRDAALMDWRHAMIERAARAVADQVWRLKS